MNPNEVQREFIMSFSVPEDDIQIHTVKGTSFTTDDVVIAKVPFGKYTVEQVANISNSIKLCFPNNYCVVVPDDFDIQFIKSTDDITPASQDELNEFLQIQYKGESVNG